MKWKRLWEKKWNVSTDRNVTRKKDLVWCLRVGMLATAWQSGNTLGCGVAFTPRFKSSFGAHKWSPWARSASVNGNSVLLCLSWEVSTTCWRHLGTVKKIRVSEAKWLWSESCLPYFLAVWFWAHSFTSLCLSFLIWNGAHNSTSKCWVICGGLILGSSEDTQILRCSSLWFKMV